MHVSKLIQVDGLREGDVVGIDQLETFADKVVNSCVQWRYLVEYSIKKRNIYGLCFELRAGPTGWPALTSAVREFDLFWRPCLLTLSS